MTKDAPADARLLFVMDNDFGALGVVMYLLHGSALSSRATLLLPRPAHELHKGQLPVETRPYESLGDILDCMRADSPSLVFLVSGYLFARQNLLSTRELRKLVREVRSRGCAIATSDPYLGHFASMAQANVPARTGAVPRALHARLGHIPWLYGPLRGLVDRIGGKKLEWHVRTVSAILADVAHVYPAAVSAADGGRPTPFCFFNPAYFRGRDGPGRRDASVRDASGTQPDRPRWLFVLAQFDLHFQEQRYGRQRFVEMVAAKLRESRDQGKRPTFVGPPAMVEELSRHFPQDSGVSLLGRCPYGEFEELLFDAQIAFYWQVFSTSAFMRLWNGLPVFSFDPGHTSRFSTTLHDAGLKHYFMGRSPHYLDIAAPLDGVALARSFEDFRQSAREALARLASLPSPEAMVEAIIHAQHRRAG